MTAERTLRALSEKQATRCENATHPRCRCRCHGRFHGAMRQRDLFALPDDDPHHPAVRRRK